jgi:hypothetical protein
MGAGSRVTVAPSDHGESIAAGKMLMHAQLAVDCH